MAFSLLTIVAACSSGSTAAPAPAAPASSDSGSSNIAQDIPVDGTSDGTTTPPIETESPEPAPEPTPSIPSGALAIFYRVTFGSNTESLTGSGFKITWEDDTKGILRYIPETNQLDVMRRVTSPSWSKNSIYPVTQNGRLFSYRDWGSDWASDNTRFDVDEMDIVTGMSMSTNTFSAASFTIAGDRLYYRTPISRDLFGNPRGGGRLMTVGLGATNEAELTLPGVRLRGVGDELISFADNTIVQRDPTSGAEVSSETLSLRLMQGIWPSERHVFYGNDALYWAVEQRTGNKVDILKVGLDGSFKQLTTVELLEGETGLIIDDDQEFVAIALTGSTPPVGFTIKRVLVYNTLTETLEDLEIDLYIPLSTADAGYGFQIAVMP